MPEDLDKRIWRQIAGAFGVKKTIYCDGETQFKEALEQIPDGMQRVFLEPRGAQSIRYLPDGDICIITGNTQMHNLKYADPLETYRISTPNNTDFYPHNAAAVALAWGHQ